MRPKLFLALFISVLISCSSGEDERVESEAFQESMLAQAWLLETAYSNIDSIMERVQPRGSKLYLEADYSYMVVTPEGTSFEGIWKVDSTGRYLYMAPAGESMKKWLIKTLESDQLITYLPLDSAEEGWVEETYSR